MQPLTPMSERARAALATYRDARPGLHRRARNEARLAARLSRRRAWWFVGLACGVAAVVLFVARAVIVPRTASDAASRGRGEQAEDRAGGRPEHTIVVPEPPSVEPASLPAVQTMPGLPDARAAEVPVQRPAPAQPRIESDGAGPDDALEVETRLVAEITRAIDAHDPAAAAAAIDEHAARFPRGVFVEERLAYAVVLACSRSAADVASLRTSFSSRYPDSPHHRMIRARCDGAR